jgi:hypothetical protein
MASISSRPNEIKYFFGDQELGVTHTTDSQTSLQRIQELAQEQIRENNIRNAKNIKVLKNGTVQILGDRNNPLHSFSISPSKPILEKAFSPVKSLLASKTEDPNTQQKVLEQTSAHMPAQAAASSRAPYDPRIREEQRGRDMPFGSRPIAQEPLASSRTLNPVDHSRSRDFSDGRAPSSRGFFPFPERAEEMDDVAQLREQLESLTLENRGLQAQLRAREVPRAAEDTAAMKATLFATRKEKYDLEILKNNQKAIELKQFLNHLQAYKLALEEREETVDIYSKFSIALSDYFSDEIKEEKAFKDKIIEKENKPKTWVQTGMSLLSLGTMGARGDANRIADVNDQMEAVKKQLEALNQRNTLLSNLNEVKDADLLQIREECDQAEQEITDLQKKRDSLIKQLGGESTNIKDPNFKFENLKTYKDTANITACNQARAKLHGERTRLKELVKDLILAAENEAKFKSVREAAASRRVELMAKVRSPKTYKEIPSDFTRLSSGNIKQHNADLTQSLANLVAYSNDLENALGSLKALELR